MIYQKHLYKTYHLKTLILLLVQVLHAI